MSELIVFKRLTFPDGISVICRPGDTDDLIDASGMSGPFKLVEVLLTEAEFEALQDL